MWAGCPGDPACKLPLFLAESEFAFLIGILRKATGKSVVPVRVTFVEMLAGSAFADYAQVMPQQSTHNRITFCRTDLELPFITYNEAMWDYFQPELTRRLADLDAEESVSTRVRSALTELLPGGLFSIDDVAEKLGMSRRTLQRKLTEENTTFQKQLNSVREVMALHYIENTNISTADIAYLLGYSEVNSFLRAFSTWTGKNLSDYR
ncbi:MAG: helix-turn-helix transcriptional regulator [Firmicutes bacterium]|nr:AraC family transcriptional regulator [Bacillota bacterium]MDD7603125.1 helix-turn-helix transcriptional regulator [Bacillota bacterium]MDY5856189.1 helix-turn-helix transcriptional regulator [Anaerovoracaceae bacterium]